MTMRVRTVTGLIGLFLLEPVCAARQPDTPLQPLAQQIRRLETALEYLGQPLSPDERQRINAAIAEANEKVAVSGLSQVGR